MKIERARETEMVRETQMVRETEIVRKMYMEMVETEIVEGRDIEMMCPARIGDADRTWCVINFQFMFGGFFFVRCANTNGAGGHQCSISIGAL